MSHAAKLLQTATTHHQAGRFGDAEQAYCKLLRLETVNTDGLRLLGALYLQTGELAKAVEYLGKAASLLPADAETHTNLGSALRKMERFQEAADAYQKALKISPNYPSALNNMASLYHDAGKASESVLAYAEILRLYPNDPAAHFNYGNSLLSTGRGNEAVARYEHALKLKPDYLEAMINLGMALSLAGKGEQSRHWLGVAQSWFEKALKGDPKNTVAMNNIGNVLRQQGKAEEAVIYYREALKLRPDYVQAAINMATSLRDLNRLDEAIESCQMALKLQPNSVDARINLGTFLQDLARHEEAVTFFAEALELRPASLDAKWNRAISLLALGRYQEAWPLHEIGLGVPHLRGDYPSPDKRWNGEELKGKRLLVWSEQGLGDSLQFVRYAAMAKARGGEIIVLCPRVLRGLFRNCSFIDALPEAVEEKDFDLHVPMMSMPYVFETTVETIPATFPYLQVSQPTREKWADKFPPLESLRVGLVWAGNPRENQINANMIDRRRSMTLETLRPLFDIVGIQFYNLQMGSTLAQIEASGLSDRFIDLMGEVKDFEDTAAIVEHLDLVISVDTSVVHLVGGMGKPVWVMSRFDGCWRWLQNRPQNPWYPSARVFGQEAPGDWTGVVAQICEQLHRMTKKSML